MGDFDSNFRCLRFERRARINQGSDFSNDSEMFRLVHGIYNEINDRFDSSYDLNVIGKMRPQEGQSTEFVTNYAGKLNVYPELKSLPSRFNVHGATRDRPSELGNTITLAEDLNIGLSTGEKVVSVRNMFYEPHDLSEGGILTVRDVEEFIEANKGRGMEEDILESYMGNIGKLGENPSALEGKFLNMFVANYLIYLAERCEGL